MLGGYNNLGAEPDKVSLLPSILYAKLSLLVVGSISVFGSTNPFPETRWFGAAAS